MIRRLLTLLLACTVASGSSLATAQDTATTIYPASVVTMDEAMPTAGAVAVRDGMIVALGDPDELAIELPAARIDSRFAAHVIVPGFIDPHIHMVLSSIQYALPLAPPWAMAGPEGMIDGLPTREAFFDHVRALEASAPAGEPLVIYGFHDLVHGDLDRHDLDAVTTDRPLIIWHYSSHDFYLNSAALDWANIDASLHDQFEGVPLGDDGQPTGRVFEDALGVLLQSVGPLIMAPDILERGLDNFSSLLRQGGVTTVADLGYGIFGFPLEDANIARNWVSPDHSGYRVYLVPEYRALQQRFGDDRVQGVADFVSGELAAPAPVLPQVKFFTDAAFYSQTMRISEPGYLAGQSQGSQGLWVIQPDDLADTIRPYWEAGFGVRIHSNGDAAQSATLSALAELRQTSADQRFVFEHAGLFSPEQVAQAGSLNAVISAASHYVFYLGEAYQAPLGAERGAWILPLGSLSQAGVPVTLHSDAPLAPPLPLRAAGIHMTRATREGGTLTADEQLSASEALESITIDAAYALGLEAEIGSIAVGKRADFTILNANPLETPGEAWPDIGIWGVVLDGDPRPLP
ncbi:amidohydrolase family protein [Parasphingopyxis sp. CP4]|uniref:amidohydrolase n=1 Tax=Parasphingopyxis sp. CP4 TaxID=2724527 RepID=UPI0015A196CC|nr:amidohydrolase family protein [Parasphingopyxis sp. CP4]QLC22923.1 amidohydrolase family protein [Parasphingopyxis sp. CP4]